MIIITTPLIPLIPKVNHDLNTLVILILCVINIKWNYNYYQP